MPYLKENLRQEVESTQPVTCGELNYAITKLCDEYIGVKGLCYVTINDILGALEGAKLEFYRRIAAPYEDQKMKENGDVYSDLCRRRQVDFSRLSL